MKLMQVESSCNIATARGNQSCWDRAACGTILPYAVIQRSSCIRENWSWFPLFCCDVSPTTTLQCPSDYSANIKTKIQLDSSWILLLKIWYWCVWGGKFESLMQNIINKSLILGAVPVADSSNIPSTRPCVLCPSMVGSCVLHPKHSVHPNEIVLRWVEWERCHWRRDGQQPEKFGLHNNF